MTDEVALIIPHEVRLEMGMLSFSKSALGDGPRKTHKRLHGPDGVV